MEKINAVYFSASGTTKKITSLIAKELAQKVKKYDLLRRPQLEPIMLDNTTPVIFAMPVFAGRIPALYAEMLNQFKGSNTPAIAVVVYGNRDYDDALLELCDTLKNNGFAVVAAAAFVARHSIFTEVASERPDEKDKQNIQEFAAKCEEALAAFDVNSSIKVPGNFPYKIPAKIPFAPTGDDTCDSCGVCVKICPAKAICSDTPKETDKDKCIACTACIAACPHQARAFRGPMFAAAKMAFKKKNALRKAPEFFFAEADKI